MFRIPQTSDSSSSLSIERSFYIENLGCAKNQVDAEVMISSLLDAGWHRVHQPEIAGVIVVNSCGFIEPAKQESIDTALQFSELYPDARIVMAGCLSQRYPGELARELPELSALMGNRKPHAVAEVLESIEHTAERIFVPPVDGFPDVLRSNLLSYPGSAYVKVAEGCDNRCSFCAIPTIRGPLRSRPVDSVVREVRHLISRGVHEINLVAQDLAAFGTERGETLADLTGALLTIDEPFWIRPLYVYPEHFPDDLIQSCARDSRLLPYFDIPLQHASPRVLKRMGRPADPERNLELIRRIRDHLPHVFIRSTFLVGFYGETDDDFEHLLDFQSRAQVDWLGVFTYSPEDGTPAMRFADSLELPGDVAEQRKQTLLERQESITHARVERLVGETLDVLVEESVEGEPMALGRAYAHAPEVDGAVVITGLNQPATPGALVPCRIVRRNGLDVEGVPI